MYFKEIQELLLERPFLNFAQKVNKDFYLEEEGEGTVAAYILSGETFKLSVVDWLKICKISAFNKIAIQSAQKIIINDADRFDAELKKNEIPKAQTELIVNFINDAKEVSENITSSEKDYLAPIKESIKDSLDQVIKQFNEVLSHILKPEKIMTERLIWRTDASVLCALFLELRNPPKLNESKYLSVGDEELIKFISDNFLFLDKNNEVVNIDEGSIRRYVTGKSIARKIILDFSKLKK